MHTFRTPGPHTVRVRAHEMPSDTYGEPFQQTITVTNAVPVARFDVGSSSPYVGQEVKFFSTSFDPEGDAMLHLWTGAQPTGQAGVASRTFTRAGIYAVSLRVIDEYGAAMSTPPKYVVVRNAPVNTIIQTSDANTNDSLRALRLISPFPIVRFVGSPIEMGARVRKISVRAPKGAKVTVRCAGKSCPFKRASKISKGTGKPVAFRKMKKRLRAGTVVAVLVSREGRIGRYVRFKIRGNGKQWRRSDLCLWPGTTKGRRCPAD
jgi:hypothetical protein